MYTDSSDNLGGKIFHGDCIEFLKSYAGKKFQCIIADPPYFRVLETEKWDNNWESDSDYLNWSLDWVSQAINHLEEDGLLYIFGQHGKREHVFIHLCSLLSREFSFHDLIVWDRVVGYSDRKDSFTPQYENILVIKKNNNITPYFDKDAVKIPYDKETIKLYLKDKRYKDQAAREKNLKKGKSATNILSIPSLKGSSKEKVGHPTQKPISLLEKLISSSSRPHDLVFDPFLGSGSTAIACNNTERSWVGCETSSDYVAMATKRLELDIKKRKSNLFSSL